MAEYLKKYASLLGEIKTRIGQAQTRAVFSANREMLALYWDIGRMITERQKREGWGAAVIPRLSRDLRSGFPNLKGFSERNIDRMIQFYREYPYLQAATDIRANDGTDFRKSTISPSAMAKLHHADNKDLDRNGVISQIPSAIFSGSLTANENDMVESLVPQLVAQLPWTHNTILIQSVKELPIRIWYMQQTIMQGWSCDTLQLMIKSQAHFLQAGALTNFEASLPAPQSDLARQTLKDPYIFDFLTLDTPFREKELEAGLLQHLERFLLELGKGFSFVGRQYTLTLGEDEFHIDLLFYHLALRCFIVIDLKVGPFKPDFAGKMNFYLNVVDDQLKHDTDNPSIGLILCRDRRKLVAEYALRGMVNPIGISEYGLTRALPENLASALPTIEEIEGAVGDGDE